MGNGSSPFLGGGKWRLPALCHGSCILALCCVIPYPVQSWMLAVVQRPWSLDGKVLVQLSRERRVQLRASPWTQTVTDLISIKTLYFSYGFYYTQETHLEETCNTTVNQCSVNCPKYFCLTSANWVLGLLVKSTKRLHTRNEGEFKWFPPDRWQVVKNR